MVFEQGRRAIFHKDDVRNAVARLVSRVLDLPVEAEAARQRLPGTTRPPKLDFPHFWKSVQFINKLDQLAVLINSLISLIFVGKCGKSS